MSTTGLLATAAIYAGTALGFWLENRPYMAGAILCYGVANVFFVLDNMSR